MSDHEHKAAELRQLAAQGAMIHTCDWMEIARLCNSAAELLIQQGCRLSSCRTLVNEQAEDEGLWFVAATAAEAYLQQELRKLHAAIEAAPSAPSEGEKP